MLFDFIVPCGGKPPETPPETRGKRGKPSALFLYEDSYTRGASRTVSFGGNPAPELSLTGGTPATHSLTKAADVRRAVAPKLT